MFVWTSPKGVQINLPPLKSIKAGSLRKHRHKAEIDFMFSILEDLLPESEMLKVDDLEFDDAEKLFQAWQTEGVTVGESSGSST